MSERERELKREKQKKKRREREKNREREIFPLCSTGYRPPSLTILEQLVFVALEE